MRLDGVEIGETVAIRTDMGGGRVVFDLATLERRANRKLYVKRLKDAMPMIFNRHTGEETGCLGRSAATVVRATDKVLATAEKVVNPPERFDFEAYIGRMKA